MAQGCPAICTRRTSRSSRSIARTGRGVDSRASPTPIDAVSAALAALGRTGIGAARTRDGKVEAIRVLRVAMISADKARTQAINRIHSLVCTAPDELKRYNARELVPDRPQQLLS